MYCRLNLKMAEYVYRRQGINSEDSVDTNFLAQVLKDWFEEVVVTEEKIKKDKKKAPLCEICVREHRFAPERLLEEYVAVFQCFDCEMYVCKNCLSDHRSHEGMKVGRNESERKIEREASESDAIEEQGSSKRMNKGTGLGKKTKRMRLEEEHEREKVREKSGNERMEEESERKLGLFLDDVIKETKTERIEKFENTHVSIYDRVNVKHELDRMNCYITGICGLGNTRWVACDYYNRCIKIFSLGSNVLQRYIRIVASGPGPWDVTEIVVNQNSNEQNLESSSSSEVSDRAKQDKQCLIAVTLLTKHQIVFIDLSKKPAKVHNSMPTEKPFWTLKFYDDKIFTVCGGLLCPNSIYIKSTDRQTLHQFDTDISNIPCPYLAVVSGRVYLCDRDSNKVQCRSVEGQLIKEITIKGSSPVGISVDADKNIYVCANNHNTVYKIDSDLTRYNWVFDQTAGFIESPFAVCYYKDKLFISHAVSPSLNNYVTVVRLL